MKIASKVNLNNKAYISADGFHKFATADFILSDGVDRYYAELEVTYFAKSVKEDKVITKHNCFIGLFDKPPGFKYTDVVKHLFTLEDFNKQFPSIYLGEYTDTLRNLARFTDGELVEIYLKLKKEE